MLPITERKCSICHEPHPIFWRQKSFICDNCLQDTEKLQEYYSNLEKKRKYRKGDRITSIDEMLKQDFIYWGNKITHKGWFKSWQLAMTENAIKAGRIYKAIKKESEEI